MTYAQLQKPSPVTKMKVVQDLPDVLVRFCPSGISYSTVISFWPPELEVAE